MKRTYLLGVRGSIERELERFCAYHHDAPTVSDVSQNHEPYWYWHCFQRTESPTSNNPPVQN